MRGKYLRQTIFRDEAGVVGQAPHGASSRTHETAGVVVETRLLADGVAGVLADRVTQQIRQSVLAGRQQAAQGGFQIPLVAYRPEDLPEHTPDFRGPWSQRFRQLSPDPRLDGPGGAGVATDVATDIFERRFRAQDTTSGDEPFDGRETPDCLVAAVPESVHRRPAGAQQIGDSHLVELGVPSKLRHDSAQARVKDVLERVRALEEGHHLEDGPESGACIPPGRRDGRLGALLLRHRCGELACLWARGRGSHPAPVAATGFDEPVLQSPKQRRQLPGPEPDTGEGVEMPCGQGPAVAGQLAECAAGQQGVLLVEREAQLADDPQVEPPWPDHAARGDQSLSRDRFEGSRKILAAPPRLLARREFGSRLTSVRAGFFGLHGGQVALRSVLGTSSVRVRGSQFLWFSSPSRVAAPTARRMRFMREVGSSARRSTALSNSSPFLSRIVSRRSSMVSRQQKR